MAEGSIASAVIPPDPEEIRQSPESGLKRRQDSIDHGDNDNKRRRVSTDDNPATKEEPATTAPTQASSMTASERRENRRKGGAAEERKRGQRLFGALLGTLSQSSSSAAQKRRDDIEKKQQTKLKQQAQEYDELKRTKHTELVATRRKEQEVYDRQSMHLRHSNLVAMAHFLKTEAQPTLYYKPWQLRPEDEAKIRDQIEEAEATVAREAAESGEPIRPESKDRPERDEGSADKVTQSSFQVDGASEVQEVPTEQPNASDKDTVGDDTNRDRPTEPPKDGASTTAATNDNLLPENNNPITSDGPKASDDDGGEVVLEDQEDTVIY